VHPQQQALTTLQSAVLAPGRHQRWRPSAPLQTLHKPLPDLTLALTTAAIDIWTAPGRQEVWRLYHTVRLCTSRMAILSPGGSKLQACPKRRNCSQIIPMPLPHIWLQRQLSTTLGSCLAHAWLMLGSCLAHAWLMLGSCLAHAWLMLGSCLAHAWLMLGSCLAISLTDI